MSEEKMMRLGQIARKLNVGTATIVETLAKKGFDVQDNPNSKINMEQVDMLTKEFKSSALEKEEASHLSIGKRHETVSLETETKPEPAPEPTPEPAPKPAPAPEAKKEEPKPAPAPSPEPEKVAPEAPKLEGIKVLGKIDLNKKPNPAPKPAAPAKAPEVKASPKPEARKEPQAPKTEAKPAQKPQHQQKPKETPPQPKVERKEQKEVQKPAPSEVISAKADSLKGLTVLGKIELPVEKSKKKGGPVASSDERARDKKRPRKRIDKSGGNRNQGNNQGNRNQGQKGGQKGGQQGRTQKAEPTQKEIQDQIKQTLARLQGNKSGGKKSRRDKKAEREREVDVDNEETKILKVTEFISANDLAALMDLSVNQIISACMSLGMFVSINQRLDAEAITIIADEFGYDVEFTKSIEDEIEVEEEDSEEDLEERAPIVTIMGHVDHGKTSLLDYIRMSKVTADEAGGITQHIGAYDVMTKTGHKIAFLDTPGHEAFTAMRARGAKITDVAIIVIAADDSIMPQTKEAINHAQVAGVPMIFAINKVDKPNANPNKIKEELANMNLLVEEWGGKYQSQDISAKTGQGVDELLEKVLLEAEILELKANPDKNAVGTVIEASLDKGRGYVATMMIQAGTLKVGDVMLAGQHYGRVKAMFDHKGKKMKEAGPSTPVQVLGLSGAPQAGDTVKVYDSEREAREIANSREQIQREQSLRTKKHITLDEIGRRLAIGSFKELNIIIKGDVDGSVEALSDSLLKLSKEEVKVSIIHKGVGQISESDVLLASASDAIIIGFQVRPSSNAKKLAEQEEIEIRHYSIIYDAINQIKDAIEGMLEPEFEEVITGNIQVREVFKISKVGTVAGSYVTDGYITRKNKIRVIRDGIVIHEGEIDQLKRFKDDVAEVKAGYECGISIKNFNNIEVDDTIEGYEMREIKRKK
ncbi:MAG TPA: translation initiation factor IF-2 [Algoriphagus sp.]|jgi:translation initiation factor IF-2|uniref:translation initiation factor IF-2 n=1 Tax=unclassified Algoriphagus TaxID=2641541 RepID=UPI000C3A8449|nr:MULTISPECIES: translation initiation factor IF-2 [unclassified Algoriphagus]MAL12380.1 translation initiation factor IF-2 [Algoriphagus sp.]HAS59297.1 translation initiation factor IF-2 [Algoriphagus sp.]HCD86785.1 translation initiation factor IF-2 [Algoriphagus sp.]|tara:strand:+ start:5220 stop:8003 length:2784 start_codon:yes stop_codon:yes gene_type:complete